MTTAYKGHSFMFPCMPLIYRLDCSKLHQYLLTHIHELRCCSVTSARNA